MQNPQVERLRARLVEIDATEQANVEAIEEKAAPLRKLEEELHPMVAKAEYHRKREEGKVIRNASSASASAAASGSCSSSAAAPAASFGSGC
eukprot:COSAG04_NODE_977_length_9041_cov_4.994520_8_plen_92_part_00